MFERTAHPKAAWGCFFAPTGRGTSACAKLHPGRLRFLWLALARVRHTPLKARLQRHYKPNLLLCSCTPLSTLQKALLGDEVSPETSLLWPIFSWPIPQHWAAARWLRGLVLASANGPSGQNRQTGKYTNPGPPFLELTVDNSLLDVAIICIVVFCEDDAPASGRFLLKWIPASQKRNIFYFSSQARPPLMYRCTPILTVRCF